MLARWRARPVRLADFDGDGAPLLAGDEPGGTTDRWEWIRLAKPLPLAAGRRTLYLRVREYGLAVDRIVLARDAAFAPD